MKAAGRFLSFIFLLALVFAGTRLIVRALPGDPLETLIAETGTAIPREILRQELGLDRPLFESIVSDASRAMHGDLGVSLLSKRPVAPLLLTRYLKTLLLTLASLGLGLAVALPLGLGAAARPGHWIDRLCTFHGAIAAALPTPWIGPVLLMVFAAWIPLFPVGGHLALPTLTLAIGFSGLWSRLIRERVRETLRFGAAPGARARGIPEWKVILKYGLAPASGALLAYLGTQFGALLAGAFVTETIFGWKGMGSLLVESVLRRDYPVVEAAAFFAAASSLAGSALGDFFQSRVDPREAAE
jgi:peptide/nickel transport system permease protein